MDGFFLLGQESRLRILQQAAARVPGCAYLCAWAPVAAGPASSSSSSSAAATSSLLLRCVDAWFCDAGAPRGDGCSRARALFDAYRGSFCPAVSGCVPGWAYVDGRAYMELRERDLTASSSLPQQHQFYKVSARFREAGIEMAAFMGCESGEIEVGMSTVTSASPVSLETNLQQVFSEEFFQQSLLEEFLHLPPTRPSSPSSSLQPSVSVDSPAAEGSTSLLRTTTTMAVTSSATTPCSGERQAPPPRTPFPAAVPFGRGYAHFPSPEADDAVMAQAMLAVISAAATTSPSSFSSRRAGTTRTTAFRAYNAALAPRAPLRRQPGATGQRMIKMGISILRRMQMLRFTRERDDVVAQQQDDEAAAPSSSQLNHMISERRRRERLNESFEALRGLLPPGSKKDKATVLAKTLEYMNILVSQISDLEARNRTLESRAHHQRANGGSKELLHSSSEPQAVLLQQGLISGSSTSERVQVHVSGGASTSSSSSRPQEVAVRVAVRGEGDVAELVTRVLAAIREMGRFTVASVDARRPSDDGVAQATFTLRPAVCNNTSPMLIVTDALHTAY
ncbi:hypothetical protein PR202_gb06635 [Eleusine coracana subsp. coracana]|uniref:BHLH domain-containing protein n=1 Tax=Eleusine coracana subsp. coracana TaxID=191504 RepID=A0AAV5EAZ7_ELECO|nr:hypothetical protein PR202_gb06635 [Eleusine coracana subsp. coracana]